MPEAFELERSQKTFERRSAPEVDTDRVSRQAQTPSTQIARMANATARQCDDGLKLIGPREADHARRRAA
jgi:hypothetical protein